jgi:hypothetical protein
MKKFLFVLTSIIGLWSCDVDGIKEEAPEFVVKETGFLTLINLPDDVKAVRVVKVGNVGVCDDIEAAFIEKKSVVVPLVDLRGGRFDKTGIYAVSLLIETEEGELLITEESALLAEFIEGEGSADLLSLEEKEEPETKKEYNLVILNLPERTDADAFKSLQIGDNAARCADFNTITMDGTTAYVPLVNQQEGRFEQTGSFYIGLNVEVDSFTTAVIDYREHYVVHFTEGIGILDMENLGEQMVLGAALKVINLPDNTEADGFKSLDVGGIAECADFDEILVKPEEGEAQIPLALNTGKEFTKSGTYYIALRIIIDSLNEIDITKEDYVMVEFENGYGTLDIEDTHQDLTLGYLDGGLTNAGNYYEPQVAGGTVFELLGNYFRVTANETIKDGGTLQSMSDGIVYVYAVPNQKFVVNAGLLHYEDSGYADFRYSKDAPVYSTPRVGWYYGNNRALWKFLKIGGEYRYKVRVDEDFPFDHEVISTTAGTLLQSYEGDANPREITLEPGFYSFEIAGAAGGGGGKFDGTKKGASGRYEYKRERQGIGVTPGGYTDFSVDDWTAVSGGSGGKIIELVNVKRTRKFWVYTGTKGKDGRMYGDGGMGDLDSLGIVGGGGGSGSYISDAVGTNKGYMLCAGGGGGGYVNFDLLFIFAFYYYDYNSESTQKPVYMYPNSPVITVKAYIPGGGGGGSGSGGAGGWLGSYGNDNEGGILYPSDKAGGSGCGGGIFGGIPYYAVNGNGIIEAAGYAAILKENSTTSVSIEGEIVSGIVYDYFVKESGGGAKISSGEDIAGNGGYITESGSVYPPMSGGNNRTAARGGNSGDGYVKIYKLQ